MLKIRCNRGKVAQVIASGKSTSTFQITTKKTKRGVIIVDEGTFNLKIGFTYDRREKTFVFVVLESDFLCFNWKRKMQIIRRGKDWQAQQMTKGPDGWWSVGDSREATARDCFNADTYCGNVLCVEEYVVSTSSSCSRPRWRCISMVMLIVFMYSRYRTTLPLSSSFAGILQ